MSTEGVPASPRKKGLIRFNPKYTQSSPSGSEKGKASRPGDIPSSTGFSKPRKYFDSADFFMREELKNKDGAKSSTQSDKPEPSEAASRGSSLASECQTCGGGSSTGNDSPDSMCKNVVPLILLRRSKSSAMISSIDGTDTDQEKLPTTVEVLSGPLNREIPPARPPSTEESTDDLKGERYSRRSVSVCEEKPALYSAPVPRTTEEIRSLLIPRLNVSSQDDTSLAAAAAMVSPTKVVSK